MLKYLWLTRKSIPCISWWHTFRRTGFFAVRNCNLNCVSILVNITIWPEDMAEVNWIWANKTPACINLEPFIGQSHGLYGEYLMNRLVWPTNCIRWNGQTLFVECICIREISHMSGKLLVSKLLFNTFCVFIIRILILIGQDI